MKHRPERTCIGCRCVLHKDEVVRIVRGPDGILIDYREKLPGRAAYVCPRKECISKALGRDTLMKALDLKVQPPGVGDFVSKLGLIIEGRIKSLLAISLKAGELVAGYSAVQDALEKGRVKLLLFASDLSDGTREKIAPHDFSSIRQGTLLTRDDIGTILNKGLIGVVGILDEGLANALWNEMQRLKNLINNTD